MVSECVPTTKNKRPEAIPGVYLSGNYLVKSSIIGH